MLRFCAIGMLVLVVAACGTYAGRSGPGSTSHLWRTLEVTNQYKDHIELYPELSGTILWKRIAKIPPYASRSVRVPAAYLNREFAVVVCRTSGTMGTQNCVRTGRYRHLDAELELVVFPSENLRAELFG